MPSVPLGVAGATAALAAGEVSAVELTGAYLSRMAHRDGELNAYVAVLDEAALAAARQSDGRRKRGRGRGPLDGVPMALKDNIDVAGVATSDGIAAYADAVAAADAQVTARLEAAGAVVLGKLNMHEGALGGDTDNPHFGRCHNPYGRDLTPGGSSGGAGAAVAAGLCAAALGTDTLGSVRLPAAYCGTVGHKPTAGLVSTRGVVPLSWTLDAVGPLAPAARDLFTLMEAIAGFDTECAQSRAAPQALDWRAPPGDRLDGITVSRVADLGRVDMEADIGAAFEASFDAFRHAGAAVVEVRLEGYDFTPMRRAGLLVAEAEAALWHGPMLERRPDGFSDAFRDALAFGARQSAPRLAQCLRRIAQVQVLARALFAGADVVILPTAPQTAFPFAQGAPVNQADLTALASLAGCPACAVPMGRDAEGLPMSLQIVAPAWRDGLCLRVAAAFETVLGWTPRLID